MTRFDPLHAVSHIFMSNPKLFELQSHQILLKARFLVSVGAVVGTIVAAVGLVEGLDTLDAAINVGGGIAGVGSDASGVGEGDGRLSLTLVDLADGGDGEGGGDALVRRGTGSPDVGSVGIGGISEGRLGLSLSLTLAKVVSVSVGTGISVSVSTVTTVVGSVGVGGNTVSSIGSVASVEEGWIGISVSGSEGSAGSEGNNGLMRKREKSVKHRSSKLD